MANLPQAIQPIGERGDDPNLPPPARLGRQHAASEWRALKGVACVGG